MSTRYDPVIERATARRIELKLNEASRALSEALDLALKVEGVKGCDILVDSLRAAQHINDRQKRLARSLCTS